jgi:hypothetical protein
VSGVDSKVNNGEEAKNKRDLQGGPAHYENWQLLVFLEFFQNGFQDLLPFAKNGARIGVIGLYDLLLKMTMLIRKGFG